jgi:hypothetical protein
MLNDTVDVRIFYPNGESYVVLAKKEIKGLLPDTLGVYFWLEEEELLRMSAAIVDAGLYPGSRLYVTKYIEPNIQEASVVTYTPSLSILSLIENDPNIIERCSQDLSKGVRKALENRLAESITAGVSNISWDINSDTSNLPSANQETGQKEDAEVISGSAEQGSANSSQEFSGDENKASTTAEDPASEPPAGQAGNQEIHEDQELGNADYFYYAEEATKDGEIEYGE